MAPPFDARGVLPPGQHPYTWSELVEQFGIGGRRVKLLTGLLAGLSVLREAGCRTVYIDGSFVTEKLRPNDVDVAYEASDDTLLKIQALEPVILDFGSQRFAQKRKYGTEFFLADTPCDSQGHTFLEFFQQDRDGQPKGIVILELRSLP
jgi:hypothetical protein